MALDFETPRNAFLDPQQATPAGYCRNCGCEIYRYETLYENGGLCDDCFYDQRLSENPENTCESCKWFDSYYFTCFCPDGENNGDFKSSLDCCDDWEAN